MPGFPACQCAFSATSWFMCSKVGGSEQNKLGGKPTEQANRRTKNLDPREVYALHVEAYPRDAKVDFSHARSHTHTHTHTHTHSHTLPHTHTHTPIRNHNADTQVLEVVVSEESSALSRQLALRDLDALYETVRSSAKGRNGVTAIERAEFFSSRTFSLLDSTVQAQHSWKECVICTSDLRARHILGLKRDSGQSLESAPLQELPSLYSSYCVSEHVCVLRCLHFLSL